MPLIAGWTRLTWVSALLMTSVASACATLAPDGNAVDRIRPRAVDCATALAGDDMPAARGACLPALSLLGKYAGW